MSAQLEAIVQDILIAREAAMRANKLNPAQQYLKNRIEQAKAEAADCLWCEACQKGITDSTAIPKPSLNDKLCLEHLALNVRWSRWFATAAEFAPSIMPEIVAEGLAIARKRMAGKVLAA